VITPRLATQLGLQPDTGAAYFAGWGARTGAMWRAFRDELEQAVGPAPQAREQACRAAIATFEALATVFEDVSDDERERAAA
jgi:heme oxygenase